jgi:hypothetical protein
MTVAEEGGLDSHLDAEGTDGDEQLHVDKEVDGDQEWEDDEEADGAEEEVDKTRSDHEGLLLELSLEKVPVFSRRWVNLLC